MGTVSCPAIEKPGYYLSSDESYPLRIGTPPDLKPIRFFDLEPGDKISQIGNNLKSGKGAGMAYHNRCDKFLSYVTYSGIVYGIVGFTNEAPTDYLLFLVRDEEKGLPIKSPIYLMYGIGSMNKEIFVPDHRALVLRIYKPNFKLYK